MIAPSRHIDFDIEDAEIHIESSRVAALTREEEAEAVKSSNFIKEWVLIVFMEDCCTATNN
jgi:hypothetical protein